MKGIILAGGSGTRLFPTTRAISKSLMPVYDKPLIYYALSTLMLAGIREVLVITTPRDAPAFQDLLGDGSQWGIGVRYAVQLSPDGLTQAFVIGRSFIGADACALALGDNILYGHGLSETLHRCRKHSHGASIFAYQVRDPARYGVVAFGQDGCATEIEEKPRAPKSNWAVMGLYFYDNDVVDICGENRASSRGELEITAVNNRYLASGKLHVERMGRGFAWFDAGSNDSLLEAAAFVQTIQRRQGRRIAVPEEIAFVNRWISSDELASLGANLGKNSYGKYLLRLAAETPSTACQLHFDDGRRDETHPVKGLDFRKSDIPWQDPWRDFDGS